MEKVRSIKPAGLVAIGLIVALAAATTSPVSAMSGGSISGTVTDVNGPIANVIRVCATDESTSTYSCTMVGADGTYTIGDLHPADGYRVVFDEPNSPSTYVPEVFDDAWLSDPEAATLVTVTSGNTTAGIDAELEIGGSISGTVRDADGPVAGEGVCVASNSRVTNGCSLTAADGTYSVTGLATADYIVLFIDSSNSYMDVYYGGVTNQSLSTPVSVTAGSDTPNIDALLVTGGVISGTVTDSNGPVPGAEVSTGAPGGVITPRATFAAADGTYVINGLDPDLSYVVDVTDPRGLAVGEWYDNAYSFDDATLVAFTEGDVITGIDFELGFGGSISGTVTEGSGPLSPEADGIVCAESLSNPSAVGCDRVAADGTYTINRLAPAEDYLVYAESLAHSTEYYDDTIDPGAATLLAVSEGSSTTDIDFELELKRAFHLLDQVCRVLDTGPISGGDSIDFDVAGVLPAGQNPSPGSCSIPPGADAVFANVIVENPSAEGNLRLTAAGTTPLGGIVNFSGNGLNNSNAQSVPLSADQRLNVSANGGPAGVGRVLADGVRVEILGWYERSRGTGLGYVPSRPCTFLDTRPDQGGAGVFAGPFTGRVVMPVDVAGDFPAAQGGGNTNCDVQVDADGSPSFAAAALVNVVLINSTGPVTLTSTDTGATIVSNIDHEMNNASAVVLPIDSNGEIDLSFVVPSGDTHVRAVLLGTYYAPYGFYLGFEYVPLPPCPTFDTRSNQDAAGGFAGLRFGGQTTTYDVTGSFDPAQGGKLSDCGVPDGVLYADRVVAVEMNLVAITPVLPGNLRAGAVGFPPSGGVLNFADLATPTSNSNAVVLPVSSDGKIDVTVNGGPTGAGLPVTHIRGVITGYYR